IFILETILFAMKPYKDFIKLKDAPRLILKLTGKRVSYYSLRRWADTGKASYSQRIIKLKVELRGCHPFTTEEWVTEFLKEVNE
ncbi:MAG TPA: hypothetical protein VMW50_08825, partial [Dehalococcoidia bacterium]|nr:hypothetical protein [Dehalococcoidia bacterium]